MSKVSIIIPAYFFNDESQSYLDLCLKSIDMLDYPKDQIQVIVSSSGDIKPSVPEKYQHIHSEARLHFPKAVNQGCRAADKDSKFLFVLNDDTCLTRNCLRKMVGMMGDAEWILNPISNCDNYLRYNLVIGYPENVQAPHAGFKPVQQRFFRLSDIPKEDHDNLIYADSFYPEGLITQDWLPIYATLIPMKVWEKVGEIDEKFMTGQDDLDFSLRCKKLNITRAVVINALAWHFGGVTSSHVINTEMRQKNVEYFISKWGHLPPVS